MANTVLPNYSFLCTDCYEEVAGQEAAKQPHDPFSGPCDRCGKVDFTLVFWKSDSTRRSIDTTLEKTKG